MTPPRWLPSRRRPPQPHTAGSNPSTPPGPNGFWLTDPAFRARLQSATLTMLDIVDNCLYDDMPLTEVLNGARYHAVDLLGIPGEYGVLVEAEAAVQIVQAAGLDAGSLSGPAIAQSLARIERRPVEEQQQFVRAAARRYAISALPCLSSARVSPPPRPTPGRSR